MGGDRKLLGPTDQLAWHTQRWTRDPVPQWHQHLRLSCVPGNAPLCSHKHQYPQIDLPGETRTTSVPSTSKAEADRFQRTSLVYIHTKFQNKQTNKPNLSTIPSTAVFLFSTVSTQKTAFLMSSRSWAESHFSTHLIRLKLQLSLAS